MRKQWIKSVTALIFFGFFLLNGLVFAADSGTFVSSDPLPKESASAGVDVKANSASSEPSPRDVNLNPPSPDANQTDLTANPTSAAELRMAKGEKFLSNLKAEIRANQKDLQEITRNVREANNRLEGVKQRVNTLKSQLDNLDEQIKNTSNMILNVTVQINAKEAELIELYNEEEIKKAALNNQKQMLLDYLQAIYERESGISDTTLDNDQISIAKLLLADNSVGDQLLELKYFSVLEREGHEIFDNLEKILNDIKSDEVAIQLKKNRLAELKNDLADRKKELEVQKNAKTHLLEETRGEEKIYQQLLDESLQQQKQVISDLRTLNDNLVFIRKKMAELGANFNPDEYLSMLSPQSAMVYDYISATRDSEDPVFHWPVSPSNGISAYFHDPAYAAFFGVQHNAIDIRTPQGSAIRAPADGIVYKVKDNGYGYSYLILAHSGGYTTTYGHISEFEVKEGDKVSLGQVIAMSGGTPGSKGAGFMTTGPHLHFEIMKNGQYVDPLLYLPINYLPLDTLPLKYQSLLTIEKPKVKRTVSAEATHQ
jgi:murein DD-endopeptidase MepM/ murein hydrolase activator NlpD